MTTDREILESLVVDDPWSYSWEGLDDCCAFCGSGAQEYGTGIVGVKYRHELTCAWIKAMAYLGREHPQHGFVEPPPPVEPCEVCLADPDATLDSHVAHLSREWAQRQEDMLAGKIRPCADSLPVLQAPRGAILFVAPPPGVFHIGDAGAQKPPMAMPDSVSSYDFLGVNRTFTPDDEDVEAFERAKALRDGRSEEQP